MMWRTREGEQYRNGLNFDWHHGPILVAYWRTATRARGLRLRFRFPRHGTPLLFSRWSATV